MGLKKTILVAIVFAAILGLYLWDQSRITKETAVKEEQSKILTISKADISAITIDRQDGRVLLQKDGAKWRLTQPIDARAGATAIDGLLSQLESARRNEPFEVADARLAEFGLAKPAARVEVKAASKNYVAEINLGAETPDGQQVYARTDSKGSVFTLPAAVLTEFTKPVNELRDKRLLPAELTAATSFEITENGQKIAARKQGEDWFLTSPEKLKGDTEQIRMFLANLNNSEAKDFLDTATLNMASLGLDKPRWEGKFTVLDAGTTGTTRTLTLMVGDSASSPSTGLYAKADTDPYVMVPQPDLNDKLRATVTGLRDKSLFQMKSADVGWITISLRGNPLYIERDSSGRWRIHGEPDTPVDQGKVSQVLAQLLALQATKFYKPGETPDVQKMGLDRPTLLVRVASRDQKTTESLETGSKAENEELVWGRLIDSDQIVGIDWTKPGTFFLTRDDIIEKSLFSFSPDAASRMTIGQDGKATMTLVRQPGGAWTATTAGQAGSKQVDAVRITAILEAMNSLNWQRRLNPKDLSDKVLFETQHLNKPVRRITVLDADGKPLGSLGLAGETDKLAYVAADGNYYAIDRARLQPFANAINQLLGVPPQK